MRTISKILALQLCTAFLAVAVVHAGPPETGRWEPIPQFTDEFNGSTLDPHKWNDHNPNWAGREPGLFWPGNVKVRDGALHLTSRHAPDMRFKFGDGRVYHTYTTAYVKSRWRVRYGYFEIKARPMKSRTSSAFWFYAQDPDWWTEIDMFEISGGNPGLAKTVFTTAHRQYSPQEKKHWSKSSRYEAPRPVADAYHIYALEWNKDEIKWYFDGEVVFRLENKYWHQPLHMNFDSETFPNWFGLPKPKNLPSTFSIDYVRSWRRVDGKERETAKGGASPPAGLDITVPPAEQAETVRRVAGTTDGLVIHLGCGDCSVTAALAEQGFENLEAFDADPDSIERTRQILRKRDLSDRVKLCRMDADLLPYDDGEVRLVVVYNAHLTDPEEIMRVLEPGGTMLLKKRPTRGPVVDPSADLKQPHCKCCQNRWHRFTKVSKTEQGN